MSFEMGLQKYGPHIRRRILNLCTSPRNIYELISEIRVIIIGNLYVMKLLMKDIFLIEVRNALTF